VGLPLYYAAQLLFAWALPAVARETLLPPP
jgi:hypothetical protein